MIGIKWGRGQSMVREKGLWVWIVMKGGGYVCVSSVL